MNKIRKVAIAAAAIIASFTAVPSAHAGQFFVLTITAITVTSTNTNGAGNQVALLQFSTTSTSPASCAPFPQTSMAVDISTNKGKAMLSNAMAALLAGKKVTVTGQGNCFVPGSTTTVLVGSVETAMSVQVGS